MKFKKAQLGTVVTWLIIIAVAVICLMLVIYWGKFGHTAIVNIP